VLVDSVAEDIMGQYGMGIQVCRFYSFYLIYATVIWFLIWSSILTFCFVCQ